MVEAAPDFNAAVLSFLASAVVNPEPRAVSTRRL
jgi:hypothetical protein